MLVQGLKDGFVVRLGGGLTKYVSSLVPIGTPGSITAGAMELAVGTALAFGVKKVTKSNRMAEFFLAGAAANAIGSIIGTLIPASTPLIGPILGAGALNAWPALAPGVAAWPAGQPAQMSGWDDYDPNLADGIFS
jgi:hypothetical protein